MSASSLVHDAVGGATILPWRPAIHTPSPGTVERSQMTELTRRLQSATGAGFASYRDLHEFSAREFRTFWQVFLESSDLLVSGSADPVCTSDRCEDAVFFPNLSLNYAENLLAPAGAADAHLPAVTSCRAGGKRERLTRGQLRNAVLRLAGALSGLGLQPGDRVAAIVRNDAEAVIAALAVAAVGAVLSTAAPELGAATIAARFEPLAPRLLLAHVRPRWHDTGTPVAERVASTVRALPSVACVIALDDGALEGDSLPPVHRLDDLIAGAAEIPLRRFPFNHPLFVMFSSGTTGRPKCIVHGAGGTLLEHAKEHRLHGDLRLGDRLFFQTSCAWMMWNWQLSALASGAEIVLYDGPIEDAATLWRIVAEERVTVFGTGPSYLKLCETEGFSPGAELDLGPLRAVLSTGSVLHDAQFAWVREAVKDVPLQSISGGTDIIGCFVLGNPNLPVHAGECQSVSLGLDVQAMPAADAAPGAPGELVCANPFPSRPLGFFGDADGSRFHAAYFARNPGVWSHGDLIEFTEDGGARLHGRCDGVLKVRGIRVGPAEIYRILQGIPEIREALAVEQDASGAAGEERVVLLVALRRGASLDAVLAARIRRDLAVHGSTAHVLDVIAEVAELPVTHSGKLSEAAARDAVNGRPLRNAEALRNPACLDAIRAHPLLQGSAAPPGVQSADGQDLESSLQRSWAALLGFSPVGLDDDFFDLGGHSLLAARMLAEIRRTTGRDLPLTTLLHAPTIRRLAEIVRGDTRLPPSSRLVLLRSGSVGRRPLYLVHSGAGSVLQLRPLVQALSSERPIYGIQPRGVLSGEEPHRRVEDMAAEYLDAIRSLQPGGPYALGGFSFGGLVALEIAQILHNQGETVDLLAMLDTGVDHRFLSWAEWMQGLRRRVRRRVRSLRGGAPPRPDQEPWWHAPDLPPAMHRVQDAISVAFAQYRPAPYAGRITFFQAEADDPASPYPASVWRRVTRGDPDICLVPGDHAAMIRPPNVEILAAVLARYL